MTHDPSLMTGEDIATILRESRVMSLASFVTGHQSQVGGRFIGLETGRGR